MTNYRSLGHSGVRVSPLGLGTANFGAGTDQKEAGQILAAAIDAGINFIDTADSYAEGESERILGHLIHQHGIRDRIVLATKVHYPTGEGPNERGNSRLYIHRAVEASLKRLQTDTIDVYFLHRPDFEIPQEETLRAMDDLISQGKIRYFGTSTCPAWFIMEGLSISERLGFAKTIAEEAPLNLADRRMENEILPLCRRYGIGVVVWSPLAGGVFAGAYPPDREFDTELEAKRWTIPYFRERVTIESRRMAVKVARLADQWGLSSGQLSLLWTKDQPGVSTVLVGPRVLKHLKPLLEILDRSLLPEMATALDQVSCPGSAVADFYNTSGWSIPLRIDGENDG